MFAILATQIDDVTKLVNFLSCFNSKVIVSNNQEVLRKSNVLFLPDLGNFEKYMYFLYEKNLVAFLKEWAFSNKPIVGLGLGMQLLFTSYHLGNFYQGLNILNGKVTTMVSNNIWSEVYFLKPVFETEFQKTTLAYFNSLCNIEKLNEEDVLAKTYDDIPIIVWRKNILGSQFSLEKSGSFSTYFFQYLMKKLKLCVDKREGRNF